MCAFGGLDNLVTHLSDNEITTTMSIEETLSYEAFKQLPRPAFSNLKRIYDGILLTENMCFEVV